MADRNTQIQETDYEYAYLLLRDYSQASWDGKAYSMYEDSGMLTWYQCQRLS